MNHPQPVLTLLAGVLLGGGLVWFATPRESWVGEPAESVARPLQSSPPPAEDAGSGPLPVGPASAPFAEPALPPTPEREAAGSGLFSQALVAYARDGIEAGWGQLRSDALGQERAAEGMGQFEQRVLDAPQSIGLSLARQASEREAALEDLRSGGVFALLEALEDGGGPLPDLVRSDAEFEALFERAAPESFLSGLSYRKSAEPFADGTTLDFPAGVFELGDITDYWPVFPRDVTLAGAGRDATLLVVGDLSADERLRNFTLRDCTVFTDNEYLFDLRREAAGIRLERVRLTGFDTGAGKSCAFGTEELALLAVDSLFVAGYGRHPEYGRLFDVRTDALVARFENCRFEGLQLDLERTRPGATVVFETCTFIDLSDYEDPRRVQEARAGIVFDSCSFQGKGRWEGQPGGEPWEPVALDLNDLFPGWRDALQR